VKLALFAIAIVLVVSCAPGGVPALRVTRYSTIPANHYPAFDRSVNDSVAARRVYDAVMALPPATNGSCPAAFGLRYRLTFNESGRVVLPVVVDGDGCRDLYVSDSDRRATNDTFWDLLAGVLGVNKELLFVKPDELSR
jgi:hypothetical protein